MKSVLPALQEHNRRRAAAGGLVPLSHRDALLKDCEAEIRKLRTALLALAGAVPDWDGVPLEAELVLEGVKVQALESAARAAYAASCVAGPVLQEPDWGRGGYKTQVLYWRAVARACADTYGLVAVDYNSAEESRGED